MADAVHCLVQIQLSFATPYISMGRMYTTGTHKRVLLMPYADLFHNCKRSIIYVTLHGKTNHIALGLYLRYELNNSPMVIIIDFDFLAWINRGIIPLHKYLLRNF